MQGLFEELRDDPAALGYPPLLAANDDEGVAELMNSTVVAVIGAIGRDELASWAAATGMRATIEDVANDPNSPFRASALSIIDVLRGASPGINLTKPKNMEILDTWEQATLLSAEHKSEFISLATHNTFRSILLFGRPVSANEIAAVVRDAFGNSLLGV